MRTCLIVVFCVFVDLAVSAETVIFESKEYWLTTKKTDESGSNEVGYGVSSIDTRFAFQCVNLDRCQLWIRLDEPDSFRLCDTGFIVRFKIDDHDSLDIG